MPHARSSITFAKHDFTLRWQGGCMRHAGSQTTPATPVQEARQLARQQGQTLVSRKRTLSPPVSGPWPQRLRCPGQATRSQRRLPPSSTGQQAKSPHRSRTGRPPSAPILLPSCFSRALVWHGKTCSLAPAGSAPRCPCRRQRKSPRPWWCQDCVASAGSLSWSPAALSWQAHTPWCGQHSTAFTQLFLCTFHMAALVVVMMTGMLGY